MPGVVSRSPITEKAAPSASSGIGASIAVSMVVHLALLGTFAAVGGFDAVVIREQPLEAVFQEDEVAPPMSLVSQPVANLATAALEGLDDPQAPSIEMPTIAPIGPGGGKGLGLPGVATAKSDSKASISRGVNGKGTGAGEGTGNGGGGRGFFGRASSGERVVFVVDSSQSMNQPHPGPGKTRLGRVKIELINSIRTMTPNQKFFIVFFNDGPIPMPADRMMEASDGAKMQYLRWMIDVPADGHTEPAMALLMALKLNPDTIYFLTDGEFRPAIVKELAVSNRGRVKIHTVGFSQDRAENLLRTIAKQSGGTYTYVPPDETEEKVAEVGAAGPCCWSIVRVFRAQPHFYSWRVAGEMLVTGPVFQDTIPASVQRVLAGVFCRFNGGSIQPAGREHQHPLSEISAERFVLEELRKPDFNLILSRIPE
jgi:hypothetical protein